MVAKDFDGSCFRSDTRLPTAILYRAIAAAPADNRGRCIFGLRIWQRPGLFDVQKDTRKRGWIGQREISVPIVHQNHYRTIERPGGDDQVKVLVAIDVAESDLQSAYRRGHANQLLRPGAHLEPNPISRARSTNLPDLHGSEVRPAIAIEIRNGKPRTH